MVTRFAAGLTIACAAWVASAARAEPTIRKDGGAYHVHAGRYDAVVAADGNLESLIVGGTELLCDHVDVARGLYAFHGGASRPTDVKQPDGHTVAAASDVVGMTYTFADDQIGIALANRTADAVPVFAVFEPAVVGVADGQGGGLQAAPRSADWATAAVYTPTAVVRTAGGTKVWGPWNDRQVWEATLAPHEERTVSFVVASPTAAESAELKATVRLNWRPGQRVEAEDVTVLSPTDYEVFQRQTAAAGRVRVSGAVRPDGCRSVRVRVTGTAYDGADVRTDWRPVRYVPSTRSFDGELAVPAGGWYAVEVQPVTDAGERPSVTVAHVGVGEVFVGAGQSNSTNFGQERTTQHSDRVSAFSGFGWRLANDPQPGAHDRSSGGSFWPAFGDAMAARYRVPVGVAVTGHGGTSVKQWGPGGELFDWTLGRVRQLGPGGFRAVLWHQGESDWGMSADEYADRLGQVILSTQRASGWACPWFVAHASYHDPEHPRDDAVRRGQALLWERHLALEGPDTDLLTGDSRDQGGRGIHLSPKGLAAHGNAWVEKVSAYLDDVLK